MVTDNQIRNDYVDTANKKYFNQQDELLFDLVVETLNNLNSPDNGYLTEQSSSEPSPSKTNTVQQQLPPPPPAPLAAPPAQTVTVSTPPTIYELSTLRPVNQSNLSNAFQILVVNANPQTAIQPSQTTNQQHNQSTSPIVVSARTTRHTNQSISNSETALNETTNNLNTTNNRGKRGVRAGTVRGPYKPRKSKENSQQ